MLVCFWQVNLKMEKANESLIDLIPNHNTNGMKLYYEIEKHQLALIFDGEINW